MLRKLFTIVVAISVTTASGQYSGSPGYPPLLQGNGGYNQSNPDPSQFGQNGAEQPDPADRQHGVARLSIVQGDVNVRRGDNGELTAAAVNAPLFSQDNLQVGGGSRAEVELDYANVLRLAPGTNLIFADIEYRQARLQLGLGTIIFRVLRNSDSQIEIDTPSVGFHPLSQGEFRISVLDDGTTQITARSGQAEIFGPHGSQRIPNGQTVMVRGNANDPEFQNTYEIGRDGLDDWSEHRDGDLMRSQSYRYVSQDINGADDLDAYGNWVPSQYGQVWAPQQAAGWSPYSTGEWAWQNYYGWTWVDSAPWGWAPYHYGRWFVNGGHGWCWWPGAVRASYFWNPAVVGFFGWGGFGVGLALGGLGWVALAPFEIFHSWWGHGWGGRGWGGYGGYGGRGDIARMYRNAAYRGGAMTAGYGGFGGPHQQFSPATRAQLTSANSFRGGVPIGPTRGSYQFSNRQAAANPRFAAASNRQFFQGARLSNRGSVSTSQFAGSAVRRPSGQSVGPNRQNSFAGSSSSSGWQRFGDPGAGSGLQRGFTNSSERSGWHTFGQPQSLGSRSSGWGGAQSYSSPRYNAPSQHYNPPSQRYSAPSQSYGAANQHYAAPSQRYSAPSQHYSAPSQHYSAPHSSGGSSHGGGSSSGGGHSGGGHGGGGHHR